MRNIRRNVSSHIFGTVKEQFIAGLVVVIPLAITYLILSWLFNLVDGIFQPLENKVFGGTIPGVGIVMLAVLIYLLGAITLFLPTRKTIQSLVAVLLHTPLVKDIYGISSQVMTTVTQKEEPSFKRVVLVDYPRAGVKSIGFVTGRFEKPGSKDLIFVFMPSTPNPTMGNMIVVEADQLTETDIGVEDALKTVMSGGMIVPTSLKT